MHSAKIGDNMTKRKRPTFSTEFKLEAAQLVVDQGYTLNAAAQSMNVSHSAMANWVKQLKKERAGETPKGGKAITPEQKRIQELEKKLRRAELENDILKKATALLMSDELNNLR